MAEALAQGFISKQKVEAKDIWATDISEQRRKLFADFGANATDSNAEVGCLAICEHWSPLSRENGTLQQPHTLPAGREKH